MSAPTGSRPRRVRFLRSAPERKIRVKAQSRGPQAHSGVQQTFLESLKERGILQHPERPSDDRSYSSPRRNLDRSTAKPFGGSIRRDALFSIRESTCSRNARNPEITSRKISRKGRRSPSLISPTSCRVIANRLRCVPERSSRDL